MESLEPFNIIYQTAEDGLGDTVKPRLMEADADLERVLVIDDRDTPLTLADERIARAIRENNARLVIIDPVQAFLGADVDMNRANAVSLEDFLRTQGETLIKSGREYRWKEHDSLTVRGNKWFRHSQSKGGYPIDFVIEFYGKSFPES